MADAWQVLAGAEDDPPGTTASCGPLPGDRRGYSVMSISGVVGDVATAGQALSPGSVWPCGIDLVITNPANGKSVRASHVDNGAGSGSYHPVIGIYPTTSAELGLSGGPWQVIIQRADGQAMSVPRGTPTTRGAAIIPAGGVAGLGGTGTAANSGPANTYRFQVGSSDNPDEDYWTAANRLAQEVNWYLFSDAETIYYIDGADLIAQDPGSNAYIDSERNLDRIVSLEFTWDNTAFQYVSTHRHKTAKVQRKAALAKVTSPTQARLDLICGIDEFRAGDLIVLSGCGPGNGRWIIADCTRSVFATYSSLTLVPPIAPLSELAAAGTTGQPSAPGSALTKNSTGSAHKGSGPYGALVDSNLAFAGVDQGIDFTGGPGHVYALADGVITRLVPSGSGWPGSPGALLVYKMTSGSHAGRYVYTAEDFDPDPSLHVGSTIARGQSIGIANGKGVAPGIETGWADPDGQASAHAPSSGPTAFGQDFNKYVLAGGG